MIINTFPKRRSIRLSDFDYSHSGYYFVTICAKNRRCLFGKIVGVQYFEPTMHESNVGVQYFEPVQNHVVLSDIGKIVDVCWRDIPNHYPNVTLDKYIIMPNHIHGILILNDKNVGVQYFEPTQNRFQKIIPGSIGSVIRGFKIGVTKWCRENTNYYDLWQRNYYEHVIRNEESYVAFHEYIENNPLRWREDEMYTEF